mmetsp:Transcript_35023/g.48757  ORF Transcript_35023/g.48757 Transcript_35023/m.48757 type:complete len:258 (-) Transcript_35023:125-898(-)
MPPWLQRMLLSIGDGEIQVLLNMVTGSRDFDELGALRPHVCRVGSHADGTCFFGSVFHSLDAKDPRIIRTAGVPPPVASDIKTDPSFREAPSEQRQHLGRSWRCYLASQVDRKWFDKHLGKVTTYEQYINEYRDGSCSVGPTHNMHVASYYQVNIFFLTVYMNPDIGELDFSIRISSPDGAAPYNKKRPSIALFHMAVGDGGHYESLQQIDESKISPSNYAKHGHRGENSGRPYGTGVFSHSSPFIQFLLSKANRSR